MCARVVIFLSLAATAVLTLPQNYGGGKQLQPVQQQQQQYAPRNYDFQWEVNDQEYRNYYGQQESAKNDRVEGSYHVLLPDNRLMKVTYYVDGKSGFVPTITYEPNYNPTWGTAYYGGR
ncbi:cuticle protein 19.8 [Procambarus clarkii]|uniref:cuticle protein 19.8 n=1 Tax=Procambarus clarkii TaxID=6728 RepID=UPI001E673F70|nr:pro-resilin-like [Procambarus clarkii]